MRKQQRIEESCKIALDKGMTYSEISNMLHISSKIIASIAYGRTLNHQLGRPSKFPPEMIDYIEVNSLANAMLTDGELTAMLNEKFDICLNRTTVARKRKELGFIYRPPLTKQIITEE